MGSRETFIETKLIASSNVPGFEPLTSLFSMEVLVPWSCMNLTLQANYP